MKILYLILPLMLLLTYIQMCLLEEKMLKKSVHLLRARHYYAKGFMSLNLHAKAMRYILLPSFCKCGNWISELDNECEF